MASRDSQACQSNQRLLQEPINRNQATTNWVDGEVHFFEGDGAEDRLDSRGAEDDLSVLALAVYLYPGAADFEF